MFLQTLLIVLSSSVTLSSPLPTTGSCKDPANLDAMWTQLQLDNNQNLLTPISLNGASNLKQSFENGTLIMGDKWCPKSSLELKSSIDASLIQRSTCPYYYEMKIDPKRYPPAMTEARCRCNGCLEKTGESNLQVCEPVTLPVKVLRNTGECLNGIWQYKPYTHYLQFACTCAVKREHESSVQLPSAPVPDVIDSIQM